MKRKLAIAALIGLALLVVVVMSPFLALIFATLTGRYSGLRAGAALEEAHQRAIHSFVDSEDFGKSRMRHVSYWNDSLVLFQGREHSPLQIQLAGLTGEKSDRIYTHYEPPRKSKLPSSDHRPLTQDEIKAVKELGDGALLSSPFKVPPGEPYGGVDALHVLGALRYSSSCLQCHHGKEGQLAGAFLYTLMPAWKDEAEQAEAGSQSPE